MTVTSLGSGSSHEFPPSALEIDWSMSGGSSSGIALALETADGRPAAYVQVMGPGRVLVTALPEPIGLVARPITPAAAFPNGLTVEVRAAALGGTGDQALVPPLDLSGVGTTLLLTVTPDGPAWTVTAHVDAGGDGLALDRAGAGSLVPASVYAARRRVQVRRLPPSERRSLAVAVDRSSSMVRHHRTGGVQALVEVAVGVAAVAGSRATMPVWELGQPPRQRPESLSIATVRDYVARELDPEPFRSGTTLGPLIDDIGRRDPVDSVLVITDDVPSDLEAVAGRLDAGLSSSSWHLMILARGPQDAAVRSEPWRDEVRALDPLVARGRLSVSTVSPDETGQPVPALLTDEHRLDAFVAGLGLLGPIADAHGEGAR